MSKRGLSQHGFTLIELLIALVVGGILAGVVLNIFKTQAENNELQQEYVALEQNLRTAMEIITKDLRMTGLGAPDVLVPFDFGDASGILDLEGDGNTQGSTSNSPPPTVLVSNDPTRNNSDALSIRRAADSGQRIVKYTKASRRFYLCNPSGLEVGESYLLVNTTRNEWREVELQVVDENYSSESACGDEENNADRTQFTAGSSAFTSTNGLDTNMNNGTAYLQPTANAYYINPHIGDGAAQDIDNDGIADDPALMVVRNYGKPVVLAFGIYRMDVTYYENVDSNPLTPPTPQAIPGNINRVQMVQITLWGQTQHPHKYNRDITPPPPLFRQRSLTTIVKIRNLQST